MQFGTNFKHLILLSGFMVLTTIAAAKAILNKPLTSQTTNIGVMLSWSTSEESNTQLFTVEKSLNGKHFTEIAQIKSRGDKENGYAYSYIDLYPDSGSCYYRLKIIHNDGSSSSLETIVSKHIPRTNFIISNFSSVNPSDDWSINLDVFINGSLVFEWIAVDGKVLDQGLKRVSEGLNTLSFSLFDWPDGIYKLVLEMAGDRKVVTIQKLGNSTIQVGMKNK